MPQNLNNRLELLEREIQGLLTLQEQQCSNIQQMMPLSVVDVQRVYSGTQATPPMKNFTSKSCCKTKSSIEPTDATPLKYTMGSKRHRVCENPPCFRFTGTCEGNERKNESASKKLNVEREKVEMAHKIVENLKEELSYSKARMCTMAKDMALLTDALQSIRNKYKTIKLFRKDAISQIQDLKSINSELCQKLEYEMKSHAQQVKNVKTKEMAKLDTEVKKEAAKLLKQYEEKYEKLQTANYKLKDEINELHKKYTKAQHEIDNLKRELDHCDQELKLGQEEAEDLKFLLKTEKNKNSIISKTIDKLEVTVTDLMRVEKKAQMEINNLKEQIEELEQEKHDDKQDSAARNREFNNLECECNRLKKQINEFVTEDTAKCKKIENEMEKLKKQMKEREVVIIDEKNTLKCLVQELSDVVKRHKTRIKELVHINRQQEGLLKNQMIVLRNKEHQVKMAEVEIETANSKGDHLQEQVEKLRNSLRTYEKLQAVEKEKDCECKNKIQCILQDLDETKQALQEEQDKLLIKEKIIDDQADTIQKLKNNSCHQYNELKQNNSEIAKLQKELQNEKFDKEQLQQNIEEISWHKEQLKDQVEELENTLKQKNNLPVKMDQQKKLLVSLEYQVTMKQKEWELRCKLLNTEKKRAVQAAKFATQKLVDTVNDFQTHAESQKQVQAMLTNMVQNKNNELKCACAKISDFKDMMKERVSRCDKDCRQDCNS